jgi:hypothetical protein
MKPGDIVTVTYPNGSNCTWEVIGVHLGGLHQESVIELTPCDQSRNPHGRTLCPANLLYALVEGGTIEVREESPNV